jgi:hypothetical protein
MTFPDFIRAQVDRLGAGQRPGAGTLIAAMVCDVSDRTIRLWMDGKGNPNRSTETGARLLLLQAKPLPADRKKSK